MRVAVCVSTFRRPEGLQDLLKSLSQQTFRDAPPEVRLIVIDNDPNGSARHVCDQWTAETGRPIHYEIEPRPGVAQTRNRAVAAALTEADYVAFVDDDEVAEPSWLDELLRVQRTADADVVTGPVVPRFVEPVPAWIKRGRFFDSPCYATGTSRDVAYTHNVLVRADIFRNVGEHFDPRFGLTGGEDSEFFRRIRLAGHTIVWAEKARVIESIPAARACASWLIKRQFRGGNSLAAATLKHGPGWKTGVLVAAKSLFWLAVGVPVTLAGMFWGLRGIVRGLQLLAFGAGGFLHLFGHRVHEYAAIHKTASKAQK